MSVCLSATDSAAGALFREEYCPIQESGPEREGEAGARPIHSLWRSLDSCLPGVLRLSAWWLLLLISRPPSPPCVPSKAFWWENGGKLKVGEPRVPYSHSMAFPLALTPVWGLLGCWSLKTGSIPFTFASDTVCTEQSMTQFLFNLSDLVSRERTIIPCRNSRLNSLPEIHSWRKCRRQDFSLCRAHSTKMT